MIEHLFNRKTNLGLIDSTDVKATIEKYGNIKMLELKLFNCSWVCRQNKNRRNRHNKKLKRGGNHKLVLLNKLEYYKIMLRGSGTLLLHCALRNNQAKLHLICLNFSNGYLYDGDRNYLPFNQNKKLEKQDALQILAKFNVTRVMNAWLLVQNSTISSGRAENLYGNIPM